MNIDTAILLGKKYLSIRDKYFNLSIEVPQYSFIQSVYIKALLIYYKNDPFFNPHNLIKPRNYETIVINRVLTDIVYESELFWCFYYKSNLPSKYINFAPFEPGGDRSGGTFILCKESYKAFSPFICVLGIDGLFDKGQIEVLEKDYTFYKKNTVHKVNYQQIWDRGIQL